MQPAKPQKSNVCPYCGADQITQLCPYCDYYAEGLNDLYDEPEISEQTDSYDV